MNVKVAPEVAIVTEYIVAVNPVTFRSYPALGDNGKSRLKVADEGVGDEGHEALCFTLYKEVLLKLLPKLGSGRKLPAVALAATGVAVYLLVEFSGHVASWE